MTNSIPFQAHDNDGAAKISPEGDANLVIERRAVTDLASD